MGSIPKIGPTKNIFCEELDNAMRTQNIKLESIWLEIGTKNFEIAKNLEVPSYGGCIKT